MTTILNLQPRWFVRPKNTDWAHSRQVALTLNSRSNHTGLHMELSSTRASLDENLKYLGRVLRARRQGGKFSEADYRVCLLRRETERFDAIYAYGRHIEPGSPTPVVWHDGPSDVEGLRSAGWSTLELEALTSIKTRAIEQCACSLVSTSYGAATFRAQFPDQAHKIRVAPFLLPHVHAADEAAVAAKHHTDHIRFLFVGRQAHRKGLDLLLPAFVRLRQRFGSNLKLDVVSSFNDGWRPSEDYAGVRFHSELPPHAIMGLMQEAHIFAMPSRVESYGIVYIEALSQGTIPLAVDREPQRSLLDGGRLGVLTQLDEDHLVERLAAIVQDQPLRLKTALAGLAEFKGRFAYDVVQKVYEDAFTLAVARTK